MFKWLFMLVRMCLYMNLTPVENSIYKGRKEIIEDGSGQVWQPNANNTTKFSITTQKRALAHTLKLEGQMKVSVPNAPSSDLIVPINYKDDYFYNLFQNFQINLNGTLFIKDTQTASIFRFWNGLYNRGKMPLEEVPLTATIKAGETQAIVPFFVLITIPYAIYDQLGAPQCSVPTWYFNSFNLTFRWGTISDVCEPTSEVKSGETTITANIDIDNAVMNSFVRYFITEPLPQNSTQDQVLASMGNLLITKFISKGIGAQGKGQYLDLPNGVWVRDFTIVLRTSKSNKRVPFSMIERLKIADGNFVLVEADPKILINEIIQKFSLSRSLFDANLADSPDNTGLFYGVLPIYTNYFGDMNNSLIYLNLRQPRLTIDFNDKFKDFVPTDEDLMVEVFTTYMEIPNAFRTIAAAAAQELAIVQGQATR